jgi:pimeloyl-ACP methyl ester carboxylesterase
MKTPKTRGIRYWLIYFLGLMLPLILIVRNYSALRESFSIWRTLWVAVLVFIILAVTQAYRGSAVPRMPVFENDPEILGFQFKEVEFPSRDGLRLSGWFIPPGSNSPMRHGVTIILTHGFSGNRLSLTRIARFLVNQGFSVLLYEMRAHGRSQGDLGTWGWLEINDLLGAVDYLQTRSDVDINRLGALGYSLGGQVTLRGAAKTELIRAVAADGPSLAALRDHIVSPGFSLRKLLLYPWLWTVYTLQTVITGVRQPPGVVEEISKIAPRPLLLISTGEGSEQRIVRYFFAAAKEPKTLYEIPEAQHAEGILARPGEYEQRLLEFFAQGLG